MKVTSELRTARRLLACLLTVASTVGGARVYGQPLIEDAFEYAPGALAGNNSGTGWSGPWALTIANASTYSMDVLSGSLAFGDYPTSGNRANLSVAAGSGFQGIIGSRPAGASVATGDLWASFLYRRTDSEIGVSNASRTAEVRIDSSPIEFGLKPKGPSSQGIRVRYDGSDGPSAAAISVQDGVTYLMVGRFTNLGTTDLSGTGTMWALTEANYDSISAGGVTVAELDNVAVLIATDVTAVSDAKTLDIGDPIALVNFTSSYPFAFDIDELRYGTSLADVVPGNPIPEPASGLLAAGAGIGFYLARRRRLN
jgi:hypothetical protein